MWSREVSALKINIAVLHTEVTNLRAEMLMREAFQKEALILKAAENDAHLLKLNGEHNTLDKMSEGYCTKEAFEAYKEQMGIILGESSKWRNAKEVEIAALKGRVTGSVFILAGVWIFAQAVISFWRTHI